MVGELADASFAVERSKLDMMQKQQKFIGSGLKNDAKRSSKSLRLFDSALYSIPRKRLDSYGKKGRCFRR